MKTILLTLMVLASVAMAGDAKMKALLTGTWTVDRGVVYTFTQDGRFLIADEKFPNEPDDPRHKWDIQGGKFLDIRPQPSADRPFTILFLTKHVCLMQSDGHGNGYLLLIRQEKTSD